VSPYSDKLSPYNYKEEGKLALLVVGVDAARFIRKESYSCPAVRAGREQDAGNVPRITRESFTLEDRSGGS